MNGEFDPVSYVMGQKAGGGGGGGGGGSSIGDLVSLACWKKNSAPTEADVDYMFEPFNLSAIYVGNSPVISGELIQSAFSNSGCLIASGSKIVFYTGGLTSNYLVTYDDNWDIASINEYTGLDITFDPNTYRAEMIVPALNQNEHLLVGCNMGA